MITKQRAEKIRSYAERAIMAAKKEVPRPSGAINWADLHCVDVLVSTLDCSRAPIVIIEEASPAASDLHDFISAYIEVNFNLKVEVSTEW